MIALAPVSASDADASTTGQARLASVPEPEPAVEPRTARTVREAVFDVMRQLRLCTIFGNPGSTEIPFLVGLPSDIHFV